MKTLSSLVILTVMGWGCQGQEQEFDLELCKNRGSHFRSNQHDYIFSGFLDEFKSNEKVGDSFLRQVMQLLGFTSWL